MSTADRMRRLVGEVWDAAQNKKIAADSSARGRHIEWGAGVLQRLVEDEVRERMAQLQAKGETE